MSDERYDSEALSASEWRRIATKRAEELEAVRRDNDRLAKKLADVSHTVTELRRDLYWHIENLSKTIMP